MGKSVVGKAQHIAETVQEGRIGGAVGLVAEKFIGKNLYIEHLDQTRSIDGLIPFDTHGVTLLLDPNDEGISKDLLTYGSREEQATETMRRELEMTRIRSDDPLTVLEIGANRGYYAFQMGDILGSVDQIYATEPDPRNIDALNRGIRLNALDNIVLDEGALGSEEGIEKMHVSIQSNSNTLEDIPHGFEDKYEKTVDVQVWSIQSYLDRHDLDPKDINVVRMDVEGYETEIFDGLDILFDAGSPDLIFTELHPHRAPVNDLHEIIDILESEGYELLIPNGSNEDGLRTYDDIREHVTVREGSHAVEIIAKRQSKDIGEDIEQLSESWGMDPKAIEWGCETSESIRSRVASMDSGTINMDELHKDIKLKLYNEYP